MFVRKDKIFISEELKRIFEYKLIKEPEKRERGAGEDSVFQEIHKFKTDKTLAVPGCLVHPQYSTGDSHKSRKFY